MSGAAGSAPAAACWVPVPGVPGTSALRSLDLQHSLPAEEGFTYFECAETWSFVEIVYQHPEDKETNGITWS